MNLRMLGVLIGVACAAMPPVMLRADNQVMQLQSLTPVAQLSQTLKIAEILAVMRDEGLSHSAEMEANLFPGQGGAAWQTIVAQIYDLEKLQALFDVALEKSLTENTETTADIAAFFGSDLGQRVISLEIEARRTLLDDVAEAAAAKAWGQLQDDKSPRVGQIDRFAKLNDLIESNVMGAMNANLAFYRGMADAGAFNAQMTEEQMLADVWGQEPDLRKETVDWLFPFLALAYQPLSDDDLDAYIVFSESNAGKQANAAIFAAFDAVFLKISNQLGHAAARIMAGQNI